MAAFGRSAGGCFLPDQSASVTGWAVTPPVTVLSVNGAIPVLSGVYRIINTGAGAYTLRAPTAAEEGTTLVLTNGSAAAHVVTATGLIQDGVVGGAKNTFTMAAFIGATGTLMAINGFWHTVSLKACVVP